LEQMLQIMKGYDTNGNPIPTEHPEWTSAPQINIENGDEDREGLVEAIRNILEGGGNEGTIVPPVEMPDWQNLLAQLTYQDGMNVLTADMEQSNVTRDLILQNLTTMQTVFGGTFDELRTLTIQANSTRESMLKLMKERYESFDMKLTNIYRQLQEA